VLPISNDTKGYKMTTVEVFTQGKGTGRLVYGKHTAMAAASRNIEQKLPEQSLAKDALIDDKIGSRPENKTRELKVQACSPTYIKGRCLGSGTKLDKTRVRNCIYLYSTQLRGQQDFNLLTRTQTIFWLNKRKTHSLDKELTIELKKRTLDNTTTKHVSTTH